MDSREKDIIDLHSHSTMSDGSDSPEELMAKAEKGGLRGIALTDHDSIQGIDIAKREAEERGIEFLIGVEIGCDDEFGNLHILGYFRELDADKFNKSLQWVKKERVERNRRILEKLNEHGIPITMSDLKEHAGEDVIGRLHIARTMFSMEYVNSMKEAFKGYLNIGGKCYAPRKTFTSEQAIDLIKEHGGLAVMAHPFLIPGQKMELTKIIHGLVDLGIDGIEVYYVENTSEQTEMLENISSEKKILRTGGTDYHGKNKPGVYLGIGRGDMRIPYTLMERMMERL